MSGLLGVFRNEFHRIFTVRPAFSVLILGVAFYAIFYPQPYLNEALRNVPIAVVDRDGTQSSRDFIRRVDATPDVRVVAELPDVASAEREVFARRIDGILVIPQYFERELLHGRPSPVALYADASYFLIYQRVAGAVVTVARTIGVEIETARLIGIGVEPVIAAAATDPLRLTAVPLFNPQGGYATYLLPAAFVLILQQTLLMGVALLRTLPDVDPAEPNTGGKGPPPFTVIAGKLLAYLALQAITLPVYHRVALSVRPAPTWWCRADPHFRSPIRAFGCRSRLCGSGNLSKADQGVTFFGCFRSSDIYGRGLFLAERGDPASHPDRFVYCAEHIRD